MINPDFKSWCAGQGIGINEVQLEQFKLFKDNLLEWNTRMNLTAITDDMGIWQKHFADSLTLLPFLPKARPQKPIRLIDVGCGAGFPGLPIKIMRPDIHMTMLDSLRKRVHFLKDTVSLLALENIECVHARAEDFAEAESGYDICTARAVARLDKLCKWCLPFVRPAGGGDGGFFLAMKGPRTEDELSEALSTIHKMRAKVVSTNLIEISPGLIHSVIVICYTGDYK